MRSQSQIFGRIVVLAFAFQAAVCLAQEGTINAATELVKLDVPVNVDGQESMLHYTSEVTPEAAAREFLTKHGLHTQLNYDTHLRAISLDIRRRLNETVDLAWLEAPVVSSVSVNLGDDRVIEFRVHDGENAQVAAEEFCLRHDIALDNAIPLAASVMRRVAEDGDPYLLFQMPVTIDNSTNYLNFYSDRIDDVNGVARDFLEAVGFTPETEVYRNVTEALVTNLQARVELLGQEKGFAREHTRNMIEVRKQRQIARDHARVLSGPDRRSGKITAAFGTSTEESRALQIKVDDTTYDIEFPFANTTGQVALTFCDKNWGPVEVTMERELGIDVNVDDCALVMNEMMISELVAEAEEAERQKQAQQQQQQTAEAGN